MIIRATRLLAFEFEVKPEYYPAGATPEEIMEIERNNANDDPEMFFEIVSVDDIKLEIIG